MFATRDGGQLDAANIRREFRAAMNAGGMEAGHAERRSASGSTAHAILQSTVDDDLRELERAVHALIASVPDCELPANPRQ